MLDQKKYYPQLDTIRGAFFLLVFLFHAYRPEFGESFFQKIAKHFYLNIPLTMDMFFVLSAFLLSLLGFREYKKKGFFSFKNYFYRSALRIWPLYFLLMFLTFVVLSSIAKKFELNWSLPPWQWYVFFVSNYYKADHLFFLRLLWSISVEEQFYLVWGICLLLFQKKIKFVIFFLSIISISFIVISTLQGKSIFIHTLYFVIDMMAGALVAYCVHTQNFMSSMTKNIKGGYSLLFYLFLPVFFIFTYFIQLNLVGISIKLFEEIVRFIFIIYSSLVIIDQIENENRIIDFSKSKFLVYTGKISYGLYCLHGIVITLISIVIKNWQIKCDGIFVALIELAITFLLASLSYYFIEKPFLKLKNNLRLA